MRNLGFVFRTHLFPNDLERHSSINLQHLGSFFFFGYDVLTYRDISFFNLNFLVFFVQVIPFPLPLCHLHPACHSLLGFSSPVLRISLGCPDFYVFVFFFEFPFGKALLSTSVMILNREMSFFLCPCFIDETSFLVSPALSCFALDALPLFPGGGMVLLEVTE